MTAPNNARERGILFSAPMVLTLLADTKTQTRRAVKPQPSPHSGRSGIEVWHRRPRPGLLLHPVTSEMAQYCPYGQPGDRLWVRETWRASLAYDLSPPRDIPLDSPILYEAGDGTLPSANAGRKRPGMFMPRWATRILLDVTEVRVERLQEISEADARAEGVGGLDAHARSNPVDAYQALWNQINGDGAWDVNPWVWVVAFKRTTNAGDWDVSKAVR
jgi:hypothetical protein